jgi:hypothetical protein
MVKTIRGVVLILVLTALLEACLSSGDWAAVNSSTWDSAPSYAPTQSSPPPFSPVSLQSGRYTCSGTSIAMSISTGLVTLYESGYQAVGNGTYRINGSTIVISFYNTSGSAASLNGRSFAYTVDDSTTFSGNGETWVRTSF